MQLGKIIGITFRIVLGVIVGSTGALLVLYIPMGLLLARLGLLR